MKLFLVPLFFLLTAFIPEYNDFTKLDSEIENFKWLLGTWEMKTSKGSIYETWTSVNSSEFIGKSYALKGKDSLFFETVRLVEKNGEVLFIPSVKDQNKGKPVEFKSSFISASKFIVENQDHDFPKIISYTQIGHDELVAEISGPSKDGKTKYQTFAMKRYPDQSMRNIDLAKMVFVYFNVHNWEKMADLYADPAEFKDPSLGTEIVIQTREQTVYKYKGLHKMAPDIKDEIVSIYPAGENHVIVEFVSSGSNSDGSKWKLPIVSIFTIKDNKIIKDFTYYDQF